MLFAIASLLGFVSIGVLSLSLFLLVQVLAAVRTRTQAISSSGPGIIDDNTTDDSPLTVLIPAHDEEAVIAKTLKSVSHQLLADDRLVVVADNCTDKTAEIARDAGAKVLERFNEVDRGKGFALHHGVQALVDDPPRVLVVIDADCVLAPSALQVLRVAVLEKGLPMQALYIMEPPTNPSLQQRFAAFAWRMKNEIRALGSHQLGFPCQLQGTGFAMPWSLVERVNFASDNIVEDTQLGIDLALIGTPVSFCPAASVTSVFPDSLHGAASQRTRWEHGHLATLISQVPKLLKSALSKNNLSLAWLAVDLAIPPLALFALINLVLLLCSSLMVGMSDVFWPFYISSIACVVFLTAVIVAWWQVGRQLLSFWHLACVPWYILRKLPIYLGFLVNRQRAWIRTERDDRP